MAGGDAVEAAHPSLDLDVIAAIGAFAFAGHDLYVQEPVGVGEPAVGGATVADEERVSGDDRLQHVRDRCGFEVWQHRIRRRAWRSRTISTGVCSSVESPFFFAVPPRFCFLGLRLTSFIEPLADFRKNISSAPTIPVTRQAGAHRSHNRISLAAPVPESTQDHESRRRTDPVTSALA